MSDPTNFFDCTHFEEGDWVESRLNTDIIGIVVGDADFGRFISVQLAGSLEIKPFHAVTLRHVADEEYEPPVAAAKDKVSNVIKVNFTERGPLRKSTKTEGNA